MIKDIIFILLFCIIIAPIVLLICLDMSIFTKIKPGQHWIVKDQNPFKPIYFLLIKETKNNWVLYDEIDSKTNKILYSNLSMRKNSFRLLYKKYEGKN